MIEKKAKEASHRFHCLSSAQKEEQKAAVQEGGEKQGGEQGFAFIDEDHNSAKRAVFQRKQKYREKPGADEIKRASQPGRCYKQTKRRSPIFLAGQGLCGNDRKRPRNCSRRRVRSVASASTLPIDSIPPELREVATNSFSLLRRVFLSCLSPSRRNLFLIYHPDIT